MGWRQRSRDEWRRLLAGWPRSGLSLEVYCARHGISVGSLRRILAVDAAPHTAAGHRTGERVRVTHVGP